VARRVINFEDESARKNWSEGELVNVFNLNRIFKKMTPVMAEWLDVQPPVLNVGEQYMFTEDLSNAQAYISGWSEEDLKMKFISTILKLGQLKDDDKIVCGFDKIISATIEGTKLTVKSDFMLAKGTLDFFTTPYFHFQEYKPYKNPSGDSMAQLLSAFLIAQEKNKNGLPMYGVDIMSANWRFVTMEGKDYCISPAFDSTDSKDLTTIIAMLRKFKFILETRLMI
jgi:hypothetical protein